MLASVFRHEEVIINPHLELAALKTKALKMNQEPKIESSVGSVFLVYNEKIDCKT